MARSDESAEQNERPATKQAAKKTAKRTAKKATAKKTTAKKTAAKKTAAKKSTRKRATKSEVKAAPQNKFEAFDRSQLGEKTRVFNLAKALDEPSKDLVVALSELGLVKVAQSTLTRAEAEQLLTALSAKANNVEQSGQSGVEDSAAAEEADEKIRQRVRKDVANEINQIERKVEAELAESAELAENAENIEPAESTNDAETVEDSADAEDSEDLLTDVEPEITPAPVEEAAAYAPVFKAPARSTRRRASRPSQKPDQDQDQVQDQAQDQANTQDTAEKQQESKQESKREGQSRRRRSRRSSSSQGQQGQQNTHDNHDDDVEVIEEPKAIKGSARLEAQRRRRSEKREEGRKRSKIVSQAEFLARRESVKRTMVVRERERHDGAGKITQVGVLEDGLLVEHFVTSDAQASMIGNIYLGRVQNVLPSMEAAFIDIGQGRNGVLYAGEVDWKAAGLGGRSRRIEHALKSGDQVLVQVTKDPIGHKGARLTTQISLAGRYLVYVPGGRSAGISRKLPAPERKRLKEILNNVVPGKGGAIIRTAAENVSEEAIAADVNRLHTQWEAIQNRAEKEKNSKGATPVTLYEEPNLLVKVVRDLFNEDFTELVVDGRKPWNTVHAYVESVAPDLLDRLVKFDRNKHDGQDAFEVYRVDEQIEKALSRTVWLPSGGSLIIDRTEAMTVIDVNTGKFTGSGGSLEETVTSNNLEAAEEIVRQIRLRDIGGIIIIDFIDMILPENQDLVLRRLKEALGRDRTRHQVSEVTSLGLVQMTRKRLGTGLLETFAQPCEACGGRGIVVGDDPVDGHEHHEQHGHRDNRRDRRERRDSRRRPTGEHPVAKAMREEAASKENDPAVEAELDEIAGSIIVGADTDTADTDQPQEKRPCRRGRRGGSRGRGKELQLDDANVNTPTDSATDTATGIATDTDAPTQTYEEAVEEFEASPRRKRRTRGNSRSDHRPKREDFVPEVEADVEAEAPAEAAPRDGGRSDNRAGRAGRSGRSAGRSSAAKPRTRERRRATRRTSTSATRSQSGAGASQGKRGESSQKRAAQAKREAAHVEVSQRRGRRRATRRTSSR